jgi:hypothetical protein
MRKTSFGKASGRRTSDKISLSNLSARSQEARQRAIRALAGIRRGMSISHAARENQVTPRTIKRYAGSALVQSRRGGRIRAAKNDHIVRPLTVAGPRGPIDIDVKSFKTASEFAKYKAAVNRWLEGETNALAHWHGKRIAGIDLVTDGKLLKDLADKDLLPYSLYRSVSGGAV